ncbi:AGE family epimerase/isomerase [Nonomuraea endophytica]|uniref:N-acylglucosamine 2-epimerase n=1 Tax=Nonomuraea endophytica TaxID=714136 RepID=A0A7W8A8A6_9ACTN|nr:AGE family epimerase/isomerase [Nonomuraea endophytica]MBB5080088.1 N-acylglucosamine 2-epimerase [Nonomuraea endophytica]
MGPEHAARRQLEDVIFPFWLANGIDEVNGGYYTCFDNRGRTRLSTDKYTWSQGRFVWLLARAARLAERGLLALDPEELLAHAERGARFLVDHAVRPGGTCAYLLDETGAEKPSERSVYADCFVAMGLSELSRQTGQAQWLDVVDPILARVAADIMDGDPPTPPYPLPPGHSGFGARMILLNARLDQVRAHERTGGEAAGPRGELAGALQGVLAHREETGLFAEILVDDPGQRDTVLARHRNPGHALEGAWMVLEAGELLGDHRADKPVLDSISKLCATGWDIERGGLLRYTDVTGRRGGGPYEELIVRTWTTKLWWVHTEAAYSTRLAAVKYGDKSAERWFGKVWDYTLDIFPGRDDGAEWVQIRDRDGRPLDEVVALPVKDPYHIARNLMQIVELGEG